MKPHWETPTIRLCKLSLILRETHALALQKFGDWVTNAAQFQPASNILSLNQKFPHFKCHAVAPLWGWQVCQPQDLAMWKTHPLRNKQRSESRNIAPNPLIITISRVRGIWGNSSNNGSRNDVTWVDLNQNIPVLLVEPEKSPTMSCLFRICSE